MLNNESLQKKGSNNYANNCLIESIYKMEKTKFEEHFE